ncbi:hypothetical protein H8356DRAFT_1044411 [Neocallimastix lanati (nom. inval.)]|uniref:SH3 domain-containing protein n=1 Tax=Neocallimastix californiae TaxID=1754190 RepID=A0A1Y2EH27_9FUNG|nr:hypothetical protein H8356DRAFT_1044411 [Neocallimastix sp. JGI-2020a]ORY70566.1 hypothetical protein LY90DRAFT_667416 [Neocallimastix californiae]|eukprot:ORY70566.1 hypothetical protein LY90DRAFT_667416 [Neocallimastix californiae]
MINLILVGISITLSIILVILLFYIRELKSEISSEEREPLLQKYSNISIREKILSRFSSRKPRIQKSREIANNLNSGIKIEDTFSILNKIDKEELLIVNQLNQYCLSFNEQRLLESNFSNNRASTSNYIEQSKQDPINLNQIQSNILSKSYGKSVPKNNTLDILKFKIYQQELEKKKNEKSVYSNLFNQYDSMNEDSHSFRGSIYENHHQYLADKVGKDETKFGSFSDQYININVEKNHQQNTIHPSVYSNKPVLNDHNHDPESSFMNCSNITSPHHSNNYQKTDSLKSSILNDESVTSILSSPSAILTSPNIFKDTSSLSIIVPKNIDDNDIENDAEYDYSINYSHSLLSHRRRSADYPSKRFMRSSMGMYSFSKNIANSSSLFTSSLPPISRPTRVQSLPKLKRNSTGSNIESKRSMVKGQDYIALSQRSFPVRANFIPDISYKDEIKLNVGDLVVITDVYVDEWAKGINIMTNSTGVFPLCYLNTDEPQAQAKTKRFTKIINQEINNNNI